MVRALPCFGFIEAACDPFPGTFRTAQPTPGMWASPGPGPFSSGRAESRMTPPRWLWRPLFMLAYRFSEPLPWYLSFFCLFAFCPSVVRPRFASSRECGVGGASAGKQGLWRLWRRERVDSSLSDVTSSQRQFF
ncbi:hypothetical protein IF2G_01622 [Cordyceps javanica]|nr:hypothetical protein IF2G_01622 [Cordyceps javanica]